MVIMDDDDDDSEIAKGMRLTLGLDNNIYNNKSSRRKWNTGSLYSQNPEIIRQYPLAKH